MNVAVCAGIPFQYFFQFTAPFCSRHDEYRSKNWKRKSNPKPEAPSNLCSFSLSFFLFSRDTSTTFKEFGFKSRNIFISPVEVKRDILYTCTNKKKYLLLSWKIIVRNKITVSKTPASQFIYKTFFFFFIAIAKRSDYFFLYMNYSCLQKSKV